MVLELKEGGRTLAMGWLVSVFLQADSGTSFHHISFTSHPTIK